MMAHRPLMFDRILGYRAHQVRGFIDAYADEHGSAPAYRQIMDAVGIGSKGEVSRIVCSLERRGLLSRTGRGRVRRISVGGALARAAWGGFLAAAREIVDRGTFSGLSRAAPSSELENAFRRRESV